MFNESLRLITGHIQSISPMQDCFSSLVNIITPSGSVNFIISSDTYIIDSTLLSPGMYIGAFYDTSLPTTLQYPPTYKAIILTTLEEHEHIMINYFDMNLLASDQSLKINVNAATQITTINGQKYSCNLGNHVLMVYFGITTASLPPITTAHRIIVLE